MARLRWRRSIRAVRHPHPTLASQGPPSPAGAGEGFRGLHRFDRQILDQLAPLGLGELRVAAPELQDREVVLRDRGALVLASLVTITLAGCDLKEFTVSTTAPVLKAAADPSFGLAFPHR